MKRINDYGQRVLQVLTDGLRDSGHSRKIANNKTYMAVSVERIDRCEVFSVAHYFEQDSDLMADPEMVFISLNGLFYPVYFNQRAGLPREEWSAEWTTDGGKLTVTGYRPKLQASHAAFANVWLPNIAVQQNLHKQVQAKKKKK